MKASSQKITLYTAIALILAIIAVIVYVQLPRTGTSNGATELIYEGQPAKGAVNAPVKVALFEDFKCPACASFDENILPRLERDYVDSGKVQLFFINFQFLGPDAVSAGIASECAYAQSESAFWDYKTFIYRSQEPESREWATPTRLVEIAQTYVPELDATELSSCLSERRYSDAVSEDRAMGERLGVNSTPSVFVNGEKVASPSYGAIRTAIEQALSEAQ